MNTAAEIPSAMAPDVRISVANRRITSPTYARVETSPMAILTTSVFSAEPLTSRLSVASQSDTKVNA